MNNNNIYEIIYILNIYIIIYIIKFVIIISYNFLNII